MERSSLGNHSCHRVAVFGHHQRATRLYFADALARRGLEFPNADSPFSSCHSGHILTHVVTWAVDRLLFLVSGKTLRSGHWRQTNFTSSRQNFVPLMVSSRMGNPPPGEPRDHGEFPRADVEVVRKKAFSPLNIRHAFALSRETDSDAAEQP